MKITKHQRKWSMKTRLTLLLLLYLAVSLYMRAYDNVRRPDTRALGLAGSEVVYSPLHPSLRIASCAVTISTPMG